MSKKQKKNRLNKTEKRLIKAELYSRWCGREDDRPLIEQAESIVQAFLYVDGQREKTN